ncbi:MAG: DUF2530 domain-containing protein [Actinomycetes bacterium]
MKSAFVVIAIGVVAWLIALVICLAIGASANAIWICVAGAGLGTLGLRYTFRRSRQ